MIDALEASGPGHRSYPGFTPFAIARAVLPCARLRAQADDRIAREMRRTLEATPNSVCDKGGHGSNCQRQTRSGSRAVRLRRIGAASIVIATGTFLNGKIHSGKRTYQEGGLRARVDRVCAGAEEPGFRVGRLKTGTCRVLTVAPSTGLRLNVSHLMNGRFLSFSTDQIDQEQLDCHIGYTNDTVHEAIRKNLHESPLYSGQITSIGPRYCPSIEDKVVKFPDKTRHQLFIEPEGYNTNEVYLNGFSTSLPAQLQQELVSLIPGFDEAQIIRPGYAIEYDFVDPKELTPFLETAQIKGLFLAGQINGTTGYEEAACQGLIAGINAGLGALGRQAIQLDRRESYIGVLIDDLITQGVDEPYRMFTSRSECRLVLRHDNADQRLTRLVANWAGGRRGMEKFNRRRTRSFRFDSLEPRKGSPGS